MIVHQEIQMQMMRMLNYRLEADLVHNGLAGKAADVKLKTLLAHCAVPLLFDELSEDEHLSLKIIPCSIKYSISAPILTSLWEPALSNLPKSRDNCLFLPGEVQCWRRSNVQMYKALAADTEGTAYVADAWGPEIFLGIATQDDAMHNP